MFDKGLQGDFWVGNIQEFLAWLGSEQRKCVPKGICGQDLMTTSGMRGLIGKYPTFEDAYNAYMKELEE